MLRGLCLLHLPHPGSLGLHPLSDLSVHVLLIEGQALLNRNAEFLLFRAAVRLDDKTSESEKRRAAIL